MYFSRGANSINYRAEIDGLRAVAVVPVILFHAGVELFSGGYVGVDVFFLISGYLIASIIYHEILQQRFSLLEFYERRSRRILPALLLITSISVVLAWVFLNPVAIDKFADSVIGVATFSSNIVFWLHQGYFEESTDFMPLIHTWSLGVEEQFYVLFPLIMLLLAKLRQSALYAVLFALVAGSLALSIWAVDVQNQQKIASGAFFLLPTRAWELGIGALIAIQNHQNITTRCTASWINNSIALLGIILIVLPMLILDKNSHFPGIAAIGPVVGTGLVIFFANGSTLIGRILSSKPIVLVGLASYSLYLWHQILLAFWRNVQVQTELSAQSIFVLILASSILSYLSFRFVERPFRNRKFLDRKKVFTMSAISLAVIGASGYATKLVTRDYED